MKKIRLLPIALLLSAMTLSGCDFSKLMFWKKGGSEESGEKADSKTEEQKQEVFAFDCALFRLFHHGTRYR